MLLPIKNSTAAFFQRSLSQMTSLRGEAEALQQQISTGERLTRSSDDPVASSQLRALIRADRLADVQSDNIGRANEELGAAAARLDDIANSIIRARELAVLAASDATSDTARTAIADEIAQLTQGVFESANGTSLSGRSLFGGDTDGPAYLRDASGAIIYAGSTQNGSLEIGENVAVERGVTGPSVFNFNNAGTPTDMFAMLQSLEAGLRGNPDPAQFARDVIGGLDAAIGSLTKGQTVIGVRLAWIDTVQQSELRRAEDRTEEGTEIGGVDLASAIAEMQQVLTVLEASQASFTRLASLNLFERI